MTVRLKDYDRNHEKRKEYIKQSRLLLAGIDLSKAKHDACIGALECVRFRNVKKMWNLLYEIMVKCCG